MYPTSRNPKFSETPFSRSTSPYPKPRDPANASACQSGTPTAAGAANHPGPKTGNGGRWPGTWLSVLALSELRQACRQKKEPKKSFHLHFYFHFHFHIHLHFLKAFFGFRLAFCWVCYGFRLAFVWLSLGFRLALKCLFFHFLPVKHHFPTPKKYFFVL